MACVPCLDPCNIKYTHPCNNYYPQYYMLSTNSVCYFHNLLWSVSVCLCVHALPLLSLHLSKHNGLAMTADIKLKKASCRFFFRLYLVHNEGKICVLVFQYKHKQSCQRFLRTHFKWQDLVGYDRVCDRSLLHPPQSSQSQQ